MFKNKQIKRVLTKAGTILELKTFLLAKTITEQDGSPRYNDVMTGVFIDWDGEVHDRKGTQVDTEKKLTSFSCVDWFPCSSAAKTAA